MYVQKRGDKYRFFETYIDPRTNERKTTSVTLDRDTVQTRKRAQALLYARICALTGENEELPVVTLNALCEAYIKFQTAHVTPQTVIGDENALKAVKEILGADRDIRTIDARYITTRLDESGETPVRKNYRLKHIKKLFRWAYQYDYLPADCTVKLTRYKDNSKSRREFKYIESYELPVVLDAMTVPKYRLLTEFLVLTGLRIGEALALTESDFYLDGRSISITKTLSLVTGEIGATKTSESTRTIHIQKDLVPIVDQILPNCFKDVQYAAYNKYLKSITLKTIGRPLTPHSLRHTHVSLLAACGIPLDVIAHRCGHADSDITRDIYLHVTQKMKDRDAALLDAVRLY